MGSLVILPSYNPDPPPDLLDGTLSGIGDEEENDEPKSGFLRFPSPLQPWLDFKQGVQQAYGFSIGGSEGMLGQLYSNSLTDNHNAVGQKFTLNVGQQILFRGTPDVMTVEAVIEDRGPVGTEFAPLQAGLRTGSSTATAPPGATSISASLSSTFGRTCSIITSSTHSESCSRRTTSILIRSSTTTGSISIRCIRRA
jgi:hypothetical protein